MSEATQVKTQSMRLLYKQFDDALVSYFTTQAMAQGPADERVFGLAQRVMAAVDRLPQSLQKQFERRRDVADSFMRVYARPIRCVATSPETVQRIADQVCCVGAYAPF
jgi:hypothetical protein